MSRINLVFNDGKKALVCYITAGYPTLEITPMIAMALFDSGCDILEIGIPFSDPVGDGPTIQQSSFQALQNGANIHYCLETAATIRKTIDKPLVFMTYYNPVFNYGLEQFCIACQKCGVDGLIIPDAPPEECGDFEFVARQKGLDFIYLLAPTSSTNRIEIVAARSTGFIYMVSLTGVTGARNSIPVGINDFVYRVRGKTKTPLCVGFGISNPEQARLVTSVADGVIVGSQILKCIENDTSLESMKTFVSQLRKSIDQ